MIYALCLIALHSLRGPQSARANEAWNPGGDKVQIKLWSGKAPNALALKARESMIRVTGKPVGGKPWTVVQNVSVPTVTVYRPKANATQTAVIVYPGGGYNLLAIDLEGSEICEWLNSIGVTAVLVKYRVPTPKVGPYRESLQALQDAQRAISWVRSRANGLGIDPKKIGVIGFSAGGHLVAAVSTRFSKRSYPRQDSVDDFSCRPDFAVALYPGHLWIGPSGAANPRGSQPKLKLNPNISVTKSTPPTFLVQAKDDPTDDPRNALSYFQALRDAKVPVELHLYPRGGHAFGLRKPSLPIGAWPKLLERWLRTLKLL
ncbi:MAG: alpha/beta hydrolase [Armatimonadetes bacterium]|nr:alpha/beta hydrolase [Armatimonadota bacterium]